MKTQSKILLGLSVAFGIGATIGMLLIPDKKSKFKAFVKKLELLKQNENGKVNEKNRLEQLRQAL